MQGVSADDAFLFLAVLAEQVDAVREPVQTLSIAAQPSRALELLGRYKPKATGERVFALSMRWLLMCRKLGARTGPIDNTPLQTTPRTAMVEDVDYVVVSPPVWEFFRRRYGGGPAIEPEVVPGQHLQPVADLSPVRITWWENRVEPPSRVVATVSRSILWTEALHVSGLQPTQEKARLVVVDDHRRKLLRVSEDAASPYPSVASCCARLGNNLTVLVLPCTTTTSQTTLDYTLMTSQGAMAQLVAHQACWNAIISLAGALKFRRGLLGLLHRDVALACILRPLWQSRFASASEWWKTHSALEIHHGGPPLKRAKTKSAATESVETAEGLLDWDDLFIFGEDEFG
jgi:hypothetical protein